MLETILVSPRYERFYNIYKDLYTTNSGLNTQVCKLIPQYFSTKNVSKNVKKQVCRKFLDYKVGNFADGELNIDVGKVEVDQICIIHPMVDDTSILELCFILDAISRMIREEWYIPPVMIDIPYMRYARQDELFIDGCCVSVASIIKIILSHAGYLRNLVFFDLHSRGIMYSLPINISSVNTSSNCLFQLVCGKYGYNIFDKNTVVIAPDVGATKRAREFAKHMESDWEIAIVDKVRTKPGESQSIHMVGQDVKGKVCVITDDIVDSAGTLCNAADMLKEKGATKIYACITHGIFSGDAIKRIENSAIEKLFVTDSNRLKDSNGFDMKNSEKIEIVPYILWDFVEMRDSSMFKNEMGFKFLFEVYKLIKKKYFN